MGIIEVVACICDDTIISPSSTILIYILYRCRVTQVYLVEMEPQEKEEAQVLLVWLEVRVTMDCLAELVKMELRVRQEEPSLEDLETLELQARMVSLGNLEPKERLVWVELPVTLVKMAYLDGLETT